MIDTSSLNKYRVLNCKIEIIKATIMRIIFSDQKTVGTDNIFGVTKIFESHISSSDTVLDFGCGGGFLLGQINCGERIGFDINSVALETAKLNGLIAVNDLDDVDNNSVDIVMSNSAIEHTPTPFEDICKLRTKT